MVDKEMLEAMSQMMDVKLAQQRKEITRDAVAVMDTKLDSLRTEMKQTIAEAEQRIARSTVTLMDAEFKPHFKLLSEELDIIKERLPDPNLLETMQNELDLHHSMLKQQTREIQALKKAN